MARRISSKNKSNNFTFLLVFAKVFTVLTPLLLMTLVDELSFSADDTKKANFVIWGVLALALGYGAAQIFICGIRSDKRFSFCKRRSEWA